jgi:hypothetical protein
MANGRDRVVNKKKVLSALKTHLGVVTPACEQAGVSRDVFYLWYKNDPEFKAAVDDISEQTIDFVEHQLHKKIAEGSERSILFYMRYKGRKRGYTDSIDITSDGKNITEIRLIPIKPKKDEDGLLTED